MRRGPLTIVLVYSTSCPHCHTYMPIWKRLCKARGRKANMVSMEADTYQQTPMSEKKEVDGVPTVLFVDKEGRISEASTPRDERVMTNAARISTPVPSSDVEMVANSPARSASTRQATPYPSTVPATSTSEPRQASVAESRQMTDEEVMNTLTEEVARAAANNRGATVPALTPIQTVIPGTTVAANPLPALPGLTQRGGAVTQQGGAVTQQGGNPWAAFVSAAASAGPAALLLGAYSALPKRSSGLAAPRRTRRFRRRN